MVQTLPNRISRSEQTDGHKASPMLGAALNIIVFASTLKSIKNFKSFNELRNLVKKQLKRNNKNNILTLQMYYR